MGEEGEDDRTRAAGGCSWGWPRQPGAPLDQVLGSPILGEGGRIAMAAQEESSTGLLVVLFWGKGGG